MSTGGSNDVVYNVINQVKGQTELDRLNDTYDRQRETLARMSEEARRAGTVSQQQKRDMEAVAGAMVRTREQVDNVEQSLARLERATGSATSRARGLANVGQSMGRGLQDLAQGGFGGIINNLEQLGDGLGKAAGFAPGLGTALTVLGTAAYLATPLIKQFWQTLSPEASSKVVSTLDGIKAKIAELENKQVKLGVDVTALDQARRQLDKLQEQLSAFEAGRKTATQEDLGQRATTAVKETIGSDALRETITKIRAEQARQRGDSRFAGLEGADEFRKTEEAAKAWRREAEKQMKSGGFVDAGTRATLDRFEDRLNAKEAEMNKRMVERDTAFVGKFQTGDIGAIAEMRRMTEQFRGSFTAPFSKAVGQLPYTAEMAAEIREGEMKAARDAKDIERRAREVREHDKKFEEFAKQEERMSLDRDRATSRNADAAFTHWERENNRMNLDREKAESRDEAASRKLRDQEERKQSEDRDRDIKTDAKRFRGAFGPDVMDEMMRGVAQGGSEGDAQAYFKRYAQSILKGRDIAPDTFDKVVEQIIRDLYDAAQANVAKFRGGMPVNNSLMPMNAMLQNQWDIVTEAYQNDQAMLRLGMSAQAAGGMLRQRQTRRTR